MILLARDYLFVYFLASDVEMPSTFKLIKLAFRKSFDNGDTRVDDHEIIANYLMTFWSRKEFTTQEASNNNPKTAKTIGKEHDVRLRLEN